MRRIALLSLMMGWLVPGTGSADPIRVLHNFDERAPGAQVYRERNLFLTSIDIGEFGLIDVVASPDATSGQNVVKGAFPGWGVKGLFVSDENLQLTPATNTLVVSVTGPRQSSVPYTLSIFDPNGQLLDVVTASIAQRIGFNRSRNEIGSFVFKPGVPAHGLDDVEHGVPVVPEPATMLLVGSGLAAAAWGRRRARTVTGSPA